MNDDASKIRKALGNMALMADQSVKQQSPKLSFPQLDGLDEVTAMLVTFAFDLQRRMEYLFLATAEFGPDGSSELARRLREEYAYLNEGTVESVPWQERAKRAHALLLKLHAEVGPEHDRLLDYVAERASDEPELGS
jgi:hypothetical protein